MRDVFLRHWTSVLALKSSDFTWIWAIGLEGTHERWSWEGIDGLTGRNAVGDCPGLPITLFSTIFKYYYPILPKKLLISSRFSERKTSYLPND